MAQFFDVLKSVNRVGKNVFRSGSFSVALCIALSLGWSHLGFAADYEGANSLKERTFGTVLNEKLQPMWSPDGRVAFYRVESHDGPDEIYRVDTQTAEIESAFDPKQLASMFDSNVDGADIQIENFAAAKNGDFLCLAGTPTVVKTLVVNAAGVHVVPSTESPFALKIRTYSSREKSRNSPTPSTVFLVNDTDQELPLFWVDPEGNPQERGSICAGETQRKATYKGHVFRVGERAITVAEKPMVAYLSHAPQDAQPRATKFPERPWNAKIIGFDLEVTNSTSKETIQLTKDGTADLRYTSPMHWSPDGRYLVVMRERAGTDRKVDLIEAVPADQFHTKRRSFLYQKAGDDLFLKTPCLFDLQQKKEIPIDDALFPNPWSITQYHWSPDSTELFFIYNQRGHQILRLLALDAATGKIRIVTEDRSDTFIDYAYKTYAVHFDKTDEVLWMSERDGWNHLYLLDRKNGGVKNQITKGSWLVRGVDHIDQDRREIWFRAGGIRPEQDPYYIHHARIRFDGSEQTVMTEGDGFHEVFYSPKRDFLIDTWSRVDQAPVHELRRCDNGALLCRLREADPSKLLEIHPVRPEPFVAKGRDGETNIYGVIFRPTHFDAAKKYPVVEAIYASPHGQFAPKEFKAYHSSQAELGFIVVRIDGMGTNWRSRSFHDVCWKNLKDSGFPDRIAWMKAAATKYPSMDLSRVGIYGGSAGGQSAMRALLDFSDFYKVASSDSACHDNRMDKIWFNEAWMGWPVDESYERSSNAADAHKLKGHLQITVGALDSNVDPSSTMKVIDALIQADKDFETASVSFQRPQCGRLLIRNPPSSSILCEAPDRGTAALSGIGSVHIS